METASRLKTPLVTRSLNYMVLGEDYFSAYNTSKNYKLDKIEEISNTLLAPKMACNVFTTSETLCSMVNQTHYLNTIDLFMEASFEKEHRMDILSKEVLEKLKNFDNFLDVGVGKGEFTNFIGQHFENITVVDNNLESLSNLPDELGTNNLPITKIHKSILDFDPSENFYDFIMISHTLYYIEDSARIPLFKKLLNSLSEGGIISVIYNDGLRRENLAVNFGGREEDFDNFFFSTLLNNQNAYALSSIEIMESRTVDPMVHVANVIIFDSSGTANRSELEEYLNTSCFDGNTYQINMKQNFLFATADSDI